MSTYNVNYNLSGTNTRASFSGNGKTTSPKAENNFQPQIIRQELQQDSFNKNKKQVPPDSKYTQMATNMIINITNNNGSSSIPVKEAQKMFDFMGFNQDFNQLKPNEKEFLQIGLDKNKDNNVSVQELATILKEADSTMYANTPDEQREFQNGFITRKEMQAQINKSNMEYLKKQISQTSNIDEQTKQQAIQNLSSGSFSGLNINAEKTPTNSGEGFNLRMNDAIGFYSQNRQVLGNDKGNEFFIKRLAEGNTGKIDRIPDTDLINYYTVNKGTSNTTGTPVMREARRYKINNFNTPVSTSQDMIINVERPASNENAINRPPIMSERADRIIRNVLTPNRMEQIYNNIDINNIDSIRDSVNPLIQDMAREIGVETPIETSFSRGYDGDDAFATSYVNNNKNNQIDFFVKNFQDIYNANIKTGSTPEEAKKNACTYLMEVSGHEVWHTYQTQLKTSTPENLTTTDRQAIEQIRSTPYIGAFESEALTGSRNLYIQTPEEAQSFEMGRILREHIRNNF